MTTDYTSPTRPTGNADTQDRHHLGSKVGTSTRATLGEHIRLGGTVKVDYKYIRPTDMTTPTWKSKVTNYTQS